MLVVLVIRTEERGGGGAVSDRPTTMTFLPRTMLPTALHVGTWDASSKMTRSNFSMSMSRNWGHRGRGHEHARTARFEHVGDLREQSAQRRAFHVRLFRAHENDAFEIVVARRVRAGESGDEFAVKLLTRQTLVLFGEVLELVCRLLQRQPGELAEHVVEIELALDEVVVDALLEAGQNVGGGNLAHVERLENEVEAASAALVHHLLIAAPAGDEVQVFLDVAHVFDARADIVAAQKIARAEHFRKSLARALAAVIRLDEEGNVAVQSVTGQFHAAFIEQPRVEFGVEFCRAVVQFGHFIHPVAHAGQLRHRHAEHGGELVPSAHEGEAVGLALGEEFEEESPVFLFDGGGDYLLYRAAGASRTHGFVDFSERNVRRIRAVLAYVFRGEHAVFLQRFAEGFQQTLRVARRALQRGARPLPCSSCRTTRRMPARIPCPAVCICRRARGVWRS